MYKCTIYSLTDCEVISQSASLNPVLSAEFLQSVLLIYQDLLSGKSPNTVIVPTSTSSEHLPPVAAEENDKEEQQDSVMPSSLAQCLEALCDRFKHW